MSNEIIVNVEGGIAEVVESTIPVGTTVTIRDHDDQNVDEPVVSYSVTAPRAAEAPQESVPHIAQKETGVRIGLHPRGLDAFGIVHLYGDSDRQREGTVNLQIGPADIFLKPEMVLHLQGMLSDFIAHYNIREA